MTPMCAHDGLRLCWNAQTRQARGRAFCCTHDSDVHKQWPASYTRPHKVVSGENLSGGVGVVIEVRQSLRTQRKDGLLSVDGLTMVAKEEVITRQCTCLLLGRRQVPGKYSNNLQHRFLIT